MRKNLSATECISEAWALIKDEYLLFLGASTFGTILLYILPLLLQGPVYSGMYILLFAKMRGERISFDRFFDGFNYFLTSFFVTLITVLPGLILTIVITVFAILLIVSGATLEDGGLSGALAGSIGILVLLVTIGAVIAISFQIMMGFAIPLVVEQGLGAVDACKKSAQAVMDNLGFVVVLVTLQTILVIAGTLACLVGVLFALPLVFASTAVAYRWIFGLHSTRQGAII